MNTAVQESKDLKLVDTLRKMEPHFAELLEATGTDVKKFMNNAIIAANTIPEIKSGEVSKQSFFNVCSRAANDGVVLDGREAAVVVGWNGKTKQKEAQYRLMSGGVMKMIRRSPEIVFVACQLVHEGDDCTISFVTDDVPVHHKINLGKPRGAVLGAYCVAKLASGEWTSPEYMSTDEINAVRDHFSQKNREGEYSPMWTKAWGEAARKTILHRAKKRLPLSDGKALESLDTDAQEFLADSVVGETIDGTTGEILSANESAKPARKRTTKVAELVKDAVAGADTEAQEVELPFEDATPI